METANDSTTFGELSENLGAAGGTAAGDLTRALVKTNGSSFQRRLEYITYDTPGNSTGFTTSRLQECDTVIIARKSIELFTAFIV